MFDLEHFAAEHFATDHFGRLNRAIASFVGSISIYPILLGNVSNEQALAGAVMLDSSLRGEIDGN